jgi:glyoxylase-like metal-dependent hydrolase (beta-lactamase superfamily II)
MSTHALVQLPPTMRVFERGWLSSNNILFLGDDNVLVDSGYVAHAPQTLALVRHALQDRRLDRIVNTHIHSDHCGGNAALQVAYGCRIAIPAGDANLVREWNEDALSFAATGQQCPRFTSDDTVAPGDALTLGGMEWQALGAPGHDPHSLILYSAKEGILISADALWENSFGVVFPELEGESGFAETRATLELIATLDLRLVIPGHGAPFIDADKALKTAFSRIDYLAAEPLRNAQNAVKVLVKFLLLEKRHIAMAALPSMLSSIRLIEEANRRHLQLEHDALAQWVAAQLAKSGVAEIQDGMLLNRD